MITINTHEDKTLQSVKILCDLTAPLSEDEWPEEFSLHHEALPEEKDDQKT